MRMGANALTPGSNGWLSFLCVAAGILTATAGPLAAQGRPKPANPLDRMKYFYGQRAYPFKRIPPRALQLARAQYAVRWPSAVQAQRITAATSTAGWTALGPSSIAASEFSAFSASGRVTTIAVDPANGNTMYIGAAGGGVWKTTDGGGSWTPLTDTQCSLNMGALAVDPVTPTIVYAGTGELNFNSDAQDFGFDSYEGCGVLRSTDGGLTWAQVGGTVLNAAAISKILVDHATAGSATTTTIFAATTQGIYKSTNSGTTWSLALGTAPFTDLMQDPSNSAVLYAALGYPYGFTSGTSPVYKSADGGSTWTALSGGLPTTNFGRVQIAVAASSPNVLYATASAVRTQTTGAPLLGVFKSTDAGVTWSSINSTGISCGANGQCDYDLYISVDPTNPNVVYLGTVYVYRSSDGGASFVNVIGGDPDEYAALIHADQHALAFDPQNPTTIIAGNDGGVYRSIDQGQSWVGLNNGLAITQFYPGNSVGPTSVPDYLGGAQDNGTMELSTGGSVWLQVWLADGGFTAINYQTPTTAFTACDWPFCGIFRRDGGSGGRFNQKTSGINTADHGVFEPPLVMDPVNPQVLYFGTTALYRTRNSGDLWTLVASPFSANGITTIAVAAADTLTIYVGTSDGYVWVTADYGVTWAGGQAVGGLPNRWVTDIAVDPANPQHAYVTVSGFGTGHVFETTNRGASWQDISASLINEPVNAVLPVSGQLFIGTDLGMFQSSNDGATWAPFTTGMPNVRVHGLAFNSATQTIVAATHGRGMFAYTVATPVVLRGDVNLDGKVTALDAQGILSGATGLLLPAGWAFYPNGDANCDGHTTAVDAQIVLSFVVGLPTSQFCVGTSR